jgi:hypothetical protein
MDTAVLEQKDDQGQEASIMDIDGTGAHAGADRSRVAAPAGARVSSGTVWEALAKGSFAVLGHVGAAGEPRSSGVVYATVDRRLYVAVAPDGCKAREIASGQKLAVTVPVRRGGILALVAPIPPATISFQARATVHPAGAIGLGTAPEALRKIVPEDRRSTACVIELVPEGRFLTYGIGVSLKDMLHPALALARVPVA